jgi:hypothetical protein
MLNLETPNIDYGGFPASYLGNQHIERSVTAFGVRRRQVVWRLPNRT